MTEVVFIFPNQLFLQHPVLRGEREKVSTRVLLIEESLFFGDEQYPMQFHKQKLAFHRASMDVYQKRLLEQGWMVQRICFTAQQKTMQAECRRLRKEGATRILCAELNDYTLRKRLLRFTGEAGLEFQELDGPGFITSAEQNQSYRASKKRWFMADYYQWQRKRLAILMDDGKPRGGQWSFDAENRKKLPARQLGHLPKLPGVRRTARIQSATEGVERDFANNPGSLEQWIYPVTHQGAEQWLQRFLEERFDLFGAYEDAIVAEENWLYHSVLTPMLNTGLLTPEQVLDKALQAAQEYQTPLNSVEGFVRQLVGWREFMRATYHDLGVTMRNGNHWQHTRPMPAAFYTATTGIEPVDNAIRRILHTGYCHHIERLMVLGGFMFLCEVHPDHIYQWFMEMFIDSYDWVMVPNVYAMSQHADGGLITTKPYFSGSNYIIKMSHYKKGQWSEIWDALFWRWIAKNADKLKGNPRWAMMVSNVKKMDEGKLNNHHEVADQFLHSLF